MAKQLHSKHYAMQSLIHMIKVDIDSPIADEEWARVTSMIINILLPFGWHINTTSQHLKLL